MAEIRIQNLHKAFAIRTFAYNYSSIQILHSTLYDL